MLAVGDRAPDFSLASSDGRKVSLSDFRDRRVVVYFYPQAATSGCTRQAVALRDVHDKLTAAGMAVIGISPDRPNLLAKFKEDQSLPFALLSDPDHEVAAAWGAWGKRPGGNGETEGIIRSHFAVDEDGRIIEAKVGVKPEETAEMALRLAQQAGARR